MEPEESQPASIQPVINYCLKNIATPQIRAMLRGSGFCVIEDFCLQRCGQCYTGPFVVVNGEEVTGESHLAIVAQLREEEAFPALRKAAESLATKIEP